MPKLLRARAPRNAEEEEYKIRKLAIQPPCSRRLEIARDPASSL